MTSRVPLRIALVLAALLASGCMTPEQRMALKVETMMERQQYEGALRYLETYLGRHNTSLNGWRYRVLIRLEQGDRATAAEEYVSLNEALSRHEPEVLREVVLGGGGRWLLSDYGALARCAPEGVADAAFFADLVEPKHLGEGSMSKVAVPDDEIAAVIDALPGRLTPSETWPTVQKFIARATPEMAKKITSAAARHLASEGLTTKQAAEAVEMLRTSAGSGDGALREAALLGALTLPEGDGFEGFAAGVADGLLGAGDVDRLVAAILLGPGGAGPTAWSAESLSRWAETAQEPARVIAVAAAMAKGDEPDKARIALLDRAAGSDDVPTKLAAVVAGPLVPNWTRAPDLASTWAALDVEDRRRWGAVFVRTAGPDAGGWAKTVLGDSDAVVGEAASFALGFPAAANAEVEEALAAAMQSADPSTRAAAAGSAVRRGAMALGNPVGTLLANGDDRATEAVLLALRESGQQGWDAATKLGMESAVPTVRELAVDAAVATCDPGRTEQMFGLLSDDDPHVAVRAASALYLLIGGAKSK
ncbi:MAG: hypothetical protein KDA24_13205 [Deltaproteobacteria bacterium]|nr:hypothetical protein [Deltaproteobacteria bacterium]